ncbi:MAG: hypothetical protein AB7L09_26810 [Nitrospira sp.]
MATNDKKIDIDIKPEMLEIDKDGNLKIKGLNKADIKKLRDGLKKHELDPMARPTCVTKAIIA